jgi:hypothetical protein
MSKTTFQRLIAWAVIFLVIFIDVPSVFKDIILIFLSLVFFFSTFNFLRLKRDQSKA